MPSFEETSCLSSLISLSVLDACLCLHVSGFKEVCVWSFFLFALFWFCFCVVFVVFVWLVFGLFVCFFWKVQMVSQCCRWGSDARKGSLLLLPWFLTPWQTCTEPGKAWMFFLKSFCILVTYPAHVAVEQHLSQLNCSQKLCRFHIKKKKHYSFFYLSFLFWKNHGKWRSRIHTDTDVIIGNSRKPTQWNLPPKTLDQSQQKHIPVREWRHIGRNPRKFCNRKTSSQHFSLDYSFCAKSSVECNIWLAHKSNGD